MPTDYSLSNTLPLSLMQGMKAFQQTKADIEAKKRQAMMDAQAQEERNLKMQEQTPAFDVSGMFPGNPAAQGLKATRGELFKGLEHQQEINASRQNAKDAKAAQIGIMNANQLRDEFNQAGKTFQTVVPMYGNVRDNAALGDAKATPASDMSLIFAYMKLLDPNSTVREGEYATAAKAGSFGDRVKVAVQQLESGKKLTDDQRRNFADAALGVYKNAYQVQQQNMGRYSDQAKRYGLNPQDVVYDYGKQYAGDIAPGAVPPWMQQQQDPELQEYLALKAKAGMK